MDRRFIEEYFPIKEISVESAREKSVRRGNISTLHIWWARRPLAASRSTIFAALVGYDQNNSKKISELIIESSKWDNSTNSNLISKLKKIIHDQNKGIPPKILDPFAGGGSIPLEALRLGCDTHSSDYNPVSVLIQKCTFEYPQLFSKFKQVNQNSLSNESKNQYIEEFLYWGKWVLENTKEKIKSVYEYNNEIPVGYLWARTINCTNPSCGKIIPLMRQFWIAKSKSKKIYLKPVIEKDGISFKISENKNISKGFDPDKGTISKAIVECLQCGTKIQGKELRKMFSQGKSSQKMLAVVFHDKKTKHKQYRTPTVLDEENFDLSKKKLEDTIKKLKAKWSVEPIPNEKIVRTGGNQMAVLHYNMTTFGDLFNERQLLTLISLCESVQEAYDNMLKKGISQQTSKAISTYLAFAIDRITDYNSKLSTWVSSGEFVRGTFSRQAIQMAWDYFELCPWSNSTGDWNSAIKWISQVMEYCSFLPDHPVNISQSNATNLKFKDNYFDAVITDPPYYDNVYYSNLADFFYVWLKRSIGFLYPELFVTVLTPKSEEIVQDPIRHENKSMSKLFFETNLKKSFQEIYRVLKPDGISVIVYAHKSTDGWETLIKSILQSGLIVTAAWPIHTERTGRLISNESAALASSIYMVVRKWKKEPIGFYREIKKELRNHLNKKLKQLWIEGISGADFFISAIGSAIEVFGKYEKIMDESDNPIEVIKLLDDTREIVTNFAMTQVLHSDFTDQISHMTRFYVLWRWAYGNSVTSFDDAKKMAQSVGINIENEWNKGFIIKDKENIHVLGPDERKEEDLIGKHDLIDVLHYVLILWKKNKKDEMDKLLTEKGYSKSDMFKRIAQAISETLPPESTEKKWLDGFLTGFRDNYSQTGVQTKLF